MSTEKVLVFSVFKQKDLKKFEFIFGFDTSVSLWQCNSYMGCRLPV